jgi:transcriptional regulator with GAF, ATPase, and Fis domain
MVDQISTTTPLPAQDDANLAASLAALSRLAMVQLDLPIVLTRIAELAVRAVPGVHGVGLTVFEQDRRNSVVATADAISEIDEIQHSTQEGPAVASVTTGEAVHWRSTDPEPGWPRFRSRANELGIHSVLSLALNTSPLDSSEKPMGVINLYAAHPDAFDARTSQLAHAFIAPAAISVESAHALSRARELCAQLQTALTSRAVIDRASGILMSRSGCTPTEAFEKLRAVSQAENRKLSAVAQMIVDEAVRRARARHVES